MGNLKKKIKTHRSRVAWKFTGAQWWGVEENGEIPAKEGRLPVINKF